MGLIKLDKGQVLHKAGTDTVETIEVVVKGSLKISNQFTSIVLTVGGVVGIVETPGSTYKYNIEALEESSVYSYPFESEDDIPNVVRSNPKIAPILAAQSVEVAVKCCDIYEKEFEDAASEYDQIMTDYSDYPNLCIKVGEIPKDFPEIEVKATDRNYAHLTASLEEAYTIDGYIALKYKVTTKLSRASRLDERMFSRKGDICLSLSSLEIRPNSSVSLYVLRH